MDVLLIFALSALMSLVSSAVIARLYVWPWLQAKSRNQALVSLVAPHMFLRFIGLSLLVPGVVSPALPAAFAVPAAYGRFRRGNLGHHRHDSAGETGVMGRSSRMAVQRLGRG